MQPQQKIPGFVDKATISGGFSMHIPKAARRYWNLEKGDVLEFYSQFTDIPDDLAANYRLIAVVVRKPRDNIPFGEPLAPGLKKVRIDEKGVHREVH